MIFDIIVGPARQKLGQLFPLVTIELVFFEEQSFLLVGPSTFHYKRVKMVIPPLSTLLACSLLLKCRLGLEPKMLSILGPIFNALDLDNLPE